MTRPVCCMCSDGFPLLMHDAVVEAGEAASAVTRLDVELVGDAQELRSAGRLYRDAERTALFHDLAEQTLVFGDT